MSFRGWLQEDRRTGGQEPVDRVSGPGLQPAVNPIASGLNVWELLSSAALVVSRALFFFFSVKASADGAEGFLTGSPDRVTRDPRAGPVHASSKQDKTGKKKKKKKSRSPQVEAERRPSFHLGGGRQNNLFTPERLGFLPPIVTARLIPTIKST